MTVGERIKRRRKELELSQSELARKMGYSGKTSVSRAENWGDNITTTKVAKFADALDCSFEYLMGWEEPIKEENLTPNTAHILAKLTRNKVTCSYVEKLLTLNDYDKSIVYSLIDTMFAKNQTIPSLSQPQNQE